MTYAESISRRTAAASLSPGERSRVSFSAVGGGSGTDIFRPPAACRRASFAACRAAAVLGLRGIGLGADGHDVAGIIIAHEVKDCAAAGAECVSAAAARYPTQLAVGVPRCALADYVVPANGAQTYCGGGPVEIIGQRDCRHFRSPFRAGEIPTMGILYTVRSHESSTPAKYFFEAA